MHHCQQPVSIILTDHELGFTGDVQQMARGVFCVREFAHRQIHVRLRVEQSSGAAEPRRLVSERLLHCSKRSLFLPGRLV